MSKKLIFLLSYLLLIRNPGSVMRQILGLVLGVKCILLILVWLAAFFYPHLYNQGAYYGNFHWSQETPSLKSWFETWDGMHYLYLSQHGYAANHPTAAFYPLWPFLIWAGSIILAGHSLITALILSNLLSLFGLWMLHDWMSQKDRPLADVTLLLILAYPGSLFFMFAYTESLFFFLSVSFLVLLLRRKYGMAALVSFFMPLTRSVGVLSMIPLFYELFKNKKNGKRLIFEKGWVLLAAPLGLLSYFLIMRGLTGDAFAGVKAQKFYIAASSIKNLLDVGRFISAYLNANVFHDFLHSFVDRFWFTLFLVSLPAIWKYNRALFYYALVMGFFSAILLNFMSFMRFLSVIFPFFIALAGVFTGAKRKYFLPPALMLLFGFQIYFLFRFIRFYWVG